MASHRSIALPYATSTVYYPKLFRAPRFILALFPLFGLAVLTGVEMLLASLNSAALMFSAAFLGMNGLGLVFFSLLYLPLATRLHVGATGLTYTVVFWRRHFPWKRVRELRLVSMDGPMFHDFVIEVVLMPKGTDRRPYPTIATGLFGWSAESLVNEMDDWRARHVRA